VIPTSALPSATFATMSVVRWKSTAVSGSDPTRPVYWRGLGRRIGNPAPSRKRRVSPSNSPLLEIANRNTCAEPFDALISPTSDY
jgi:hypothetical protein